MKGFFERLKKAAVNTWKWFKSLPVVKPLFMLVYSRKALIATGLTGFVLEAFPKLSPVNDEVVIVVAQLVVIGFIWIAQILGIAIEDASK